MFILFLLYIFTFFINQDYETTTHILYVNTSSHEFCILIKVEENKNFDTDANIFVIFFLIYKFPLYLATLTNELFAADALFYFFTDFAFPILIICIKIFSSSKLSLVGAIRIFRFMANVSRNVQTALSIRALSLSPT